LVRTELGEAADVHLLADLGPGRSLATGRSRNVADPASSIYTCVHAALGADLRLAFEDRERLDHGVLPIVTVASTNVLSG